ncbi:hypothetical protein FOE78_14930 [Microlunatus elymi]|uniref:Nitroreductase family protein n=1 Tax=Microlunatus elymi TaxID=2596828 RepID=A0A516Q0T4_9ACTN|nr:hypothetical protein [Microlunatus elymi]QDP97044.1 hypothetical protein FOE78_14930 [Microlunatus elymi]
MGVATSDHTVGMGMIMVGADNNASAFRRAAVRAAMAPSICNTQPWRFILSPGLLDIYPERNRQLPLRDPSGRQLVISLGCALMNARVQLAVDRVEIAVQRFTDDVLGDHRVGVGPAASITAGTGAVGCSELAALAEVPELPGEPPSGTSATLGDDLVDSLIAAAEAESTSLINISDQQQSLLGLVSETWAAIEQNSAERAELLAWSPGDITLWADSAPVLARFDHETAPLMTLLISTRGDRGSDWLRTGEALQRLLLMLQQRGLTAMPDTQLTDDPETRQRLQPEADLRPQVVLFVGTAPAEPTARRRRLSDVITEQF